MFNRKAFTLIELVMVMVILGILAAVALPTFFNLQDKAKEEACKGALGGLRSGIAIWYAKEAASGTPTWPTLGELTAPSFGVMAGGIIPENPYTQSNIVKASITGEEEEDTSVGWIYDEATGRIWSSASETQGSGW